MPGEIVVNDLYCSEGRMVVVVVTLGPILPGKSRHAIVVYMCVSTRNKRRLPWCLPLKVPFQTRFTTYT